MAGVSVPRRGRRRKSRQRRFSLPTCSSAQALRRGASSTRACRPRGVLRGRGSRWLLFSPHLPLRPRLSRLPPRQRHLA
eukprot:5385047-Alexandrium_andersonii.AAC.1